MAPSMIMLIASFVLASRVHCESLTLNKYLCGSIDDYMCSHGLVECY
jgi:hypothetical protein